ncbi:MAG: T9SS type A sorting domain-containing protein [Bacteroidetes bacterium]|nr:T9SS type A sorting domain-containing protein [Bacteroidota bacterium]
MKFIFFILFFTSFVFTGRIFSQETDDGETSETIIQRENYITERRAGGPGKILSDDAYEKAVNEKKSILEDKHDIRSSTSLTVWVSVNPTGMFYSRTNNNYIAGRTNSIAFHPTNPNIFYIAAAQGGVWKTTDGGITWTVLTDTLGSIASGDIAVDPSNPNILYYGTGELNNSGDSQYGDGVYKSTDAGASWIKISPASVTGTYTGKIVIDPVNTANLYLAGNQGIFKSTNSGLNWTNVLFLNSSSLIINPVNPLILFASSGNVQAQIFKTTNGGLNWTLLTNGLNISNGRRTQLAISPDNPDYIYASIASSSGALLGLYRTTNSGDNWTLQNSSTNYMSSQGWYDNAVTVVPGDPEKVIVGGLDIYASVNGGVTLTKKTTWSTSSQTDFSHADIHYLAFKGTVLYCCSDGGVYKSPDNANTWTDLNLNMSTLQFQSADYDPTNPLFLYGGTQDNNKQTSTDGGLFWNQRTTGDGGYTIVDPVNTNYVFGQYVQGSIQRSANFGVSFSDITPSGSTGGLFYNPYEMAPGDHNTVVFGRADVWKTSSVQTASTSTGWTQIATTAITGGNISAIGISNTSTDKIYIGTSNGRIHVTTNNGVDWATQTGFPYVSDFWVDRSNDDICYATFGGASVDKHVYKTTNGGVNWSSISANLPNIGTNTIAVKESNPKMIFVGTDLGVFRSTNEGQSWTSFNTGFPNVEVYDLKYKEGAAVLLAATHGRGCFTFDVSAVNGISSINSTPEKFSLNQNYPNPFNPSTSFTFTIAEMSFVTLKIYNSLGKEVYTLISKEYPAGTFEYKFDASGLSGGVYFYKLTAGNYTASRSMILIK